MPARARNGLAMRAGLFLEGLSRSHAVRLVVLPPFGAAPADDEFARGLAQSCVTLRPADPGQEDWAGLLLSTPAGRDRAERLYPLPPVCRLPDREGIAQLRETVAGAQLVHVFRTYMAPCVDFLFDADERPAVTLDVDELDSCVERQLGRGSMATRFERLERYYLPHADHVYVASELEARTVEQQHAVAAATVVPNAVWPPPAIPPAEPRYDLLFVGNLSYEPNAEAAKWICEQVLPLLDGVRIAVVGSSPGPAVRALGRPPAVTVAPDVGEVASWYASSRIAIAPLRAGGGTRIKILEALAHERPVIATPVGAAGLQTGEQSGVLTAETAEEFAAACRRLLDDPGLARQMATAGRQRLKPAGEAAAQIDALITSARATQARAPASLARLRALEAE